MGLREQCGQIDLQDVAADDLRPAPSSGIFRTGETLLEFRDQKRIDLDQGDRPPREFLDQELAQDPPAGADLQDRPRRCVQEFDDLAGEIPVAQEILAELRRFVHVGIIYRGGLFSKRSSSGSAYSDK